MIIDVQMKVDIIVLGLCIIRDILVRGGFTTEIIESEFMGNFGNQNTWFYTMLYEYLLFRNCFLKFQNKSNFIHITLLLDWNDYYAYP